MNCVIKARKLADYISNIPGGLCNCQLNDQFSYNHIGALFTDIVLQAGVNYNSVVKPRVCRVLSQYPHEITLKRFQVIIKNNKLQTIINWNHHVKINRFERLLEFSEERGIDSCMDMKSFLLGGNGQQQFLSLHGFGPKTLDYLLKLLNVDNVAVDRHIYTFVKMAEIEVKGYYETKRVVEYAADLLNMSRTAIDQIIWRYMSEKSRHNKPINNCKFAFDLT